MADATSTPDRRKYPRLGTDQVISFAYVDEDSGGGGQLAVGTDISKGGIRFEAVGCEIELGALLRVTFNVGDQTVVAVGRVSWAIDADPLTQDVGIEFTEIDPRALELLESVVEPDSSF